MRAMNPGSDSKRLEAGLNSTGPDPDAQRGAKRDQVPAFALDDAAEDLQVELLVLVDDHVAEPDHGAHLFCQTELDPPGGGQKLEGVGARLRNSEVISRDHVH